MRALFGFLVLVVMGTGSSALALPNRTQNFDVDPGWTSVGSGLQGNDFGYQTTSYAGGSPGEAGGRFTRSNIIPPLIYADTNFGGIISFDEPFSASGRFDFTGSYRPDFNGLSLGHFSRNLGTRVGIVFGDGEQIEADHLRWGADFRHNDVAFPFLPGGAFPASPPNIDHIWSYSWDPNGGETQNGTLTVTFDGVTKVSELTPELRALLAGAGVESFGFHGGHGDDPRPFLFADMFIDDVTYSVIPLLLGDMDLDGDVDFDDIDPFVLALFNESDYEMMFGVTPELHGDMDGSGNHDFDDIPGFVEAIRAGNSPQTVPEPTSLVLGIIGLFGFIVGRSASRWRIQ